MMNSATTKIGILGSGDVAQVLALGFLSRKHEVMLGTRDNGDKLKPWQTQHAPSAKLGSFSETAAFADVVLIAVKGFAAEALVKSLAPYLVGKVVIDATNPISENKPPQNGVLHFFTGPNDSLMERLQANAPEARFVKAFNSVGSSLMVDPKLESRPSMFICGNDEAAKATVTKMLNAFGWDAEDMGKATSARAIEPLCTLWCAPGFIRNDWRHAFKMLR